MELTPLQTEEKSAYLQYLLLAEENEEIINEYIDDGEMYAI